MNKVVMMGRLVGDPKISYSKNGNAMAIARYRLAVARKSKKQGEAAADFFSCVVFGKSAEFAERYLHKGTQICISGRLQTGSYVNNENQKVTTTEIVVEDTSFAGPKQENTMPGNTMPNNQGYGAYAQQQSGYQTGPNNMQMPQMPWQVLPRCKAMVMELMPECPQMLAMCHKTRTREAIMVETRVATHRTSPRGWLQMQMSLVS